MKNISKGNFVYWKKCFMFAKVSNGNNVKCKINCKYYESREAG